MNYVVIHIPKTAGTSLQSLLRDTFGTVEVSDRFAARPLTEEDAIELRRHRVVLGHISWNDTKRFFDDRRTITFLREPIDRCLSWHAFLLGQEPDPNVSIEPADFRNDAAQAIALAHRLPMNEFFACGHPHVIQNVGNRMVHQLAGESVVDRREQDDDAALSQAVANLALIDFVGVYERLAEDVARLGTFLGHPGPVRLPHLNRTGSRRRRDEVEDDVLEAIATLNELDIGLYGEVMAATRH